MLLKECVLIGLKELWANKVRSFLSVLGIIIGIIALVTMMAIMTGMERYWLAYINEMGGMKMATITSKTPVVDGHERKDLKRPLTLDDAELIKRQKSLVRYVSSEAKTVKRVSFGGGRADFIQITGGTRDTLDVNRQRLASGRPITDEDITRVRNVCVIGTAIRDSLFGPRVNPVGQDIEIEGQLFEVIGLLEKNVLMRRKKNLLRRKNRVIYVPLSVLQKQFEEEKAISEIRYVVHRRKDISRALREIERLIDQNHRMAGDFEIKTQEERYLESKKSIRTMKLSFSFIAGISLIVGGIGIMNIMIASVAQRVVEIGVRKAVGARPKDILHQFLVESVMISALGGLLGILGSFIVVFIIGGVMKDMQPIVGPDAVILAAAFSILVGVCFGVYPAFKASRLNPIEALRFQ